MSISARISRIVFGTRTFLMANYERARSNPKRTIILTVFVLAVIALFTLGEDAAETPELETRTPSVTLTSVAELSSDEEALVLLGEVRSVSQAELRAQKSGTISRVYVPAGTYISAGTIIAEIESASERAMVLGAEGTLSAAQAQLAKVRAGARTEDRASASASADSALVSLSAAQENARNTYSQAYALAATAIFAQADTLFTNVYTVMPSFRIRTASYDERQVLEKERVALGNILEEWSERTESTIPTSELDAVLVEAQNTLDRVKQFLNTISGYVSEQETGEYLSVADKAVQEGALQSARSSVDAGRSAVVGARQGLAAAMSAAVAARAGESKITVGERPEDIQIAEASVTQARASLASARAMLENALIRSPIAGTLTTQNVSVGAFVNTFDSIAVVANPGALEVETYVSALALDRITVGMPVLVGGSYEGVITSRAPGLDPTTKKARVTVSLPDDAPLVNGSFVEISVSTNEEAPTPTASARDGFAIPITAIKVLPRGLAVFTVNESSELEARAISEGPIVGAKMFVKEGLSPELMIVTDVRGRKEGDLVTVTTL